MRRRVAKGFKVWGLVRVRVEGYVRFTTDLGFVILFGAAGRDAPSHT